MLIAGSGEDGLLRMLVVCSGGGLMLESTW
jgi:hypothetical protein